MAPECPCESMSILSSRLHLSVDLLGTVASGNQTRHDTRVSFVVHLHDCEADTSASFVSGECTNLSLVISLYLCLSRSVCLPVCLCSLHSPFPPLLSLSPFLAPPPASVCLSVCLSLSLSCLCLSVCLSVCLSPSLSLTDTQRRSHTVYAPNPCYKFNPRFVSTCQNKDLDNLWRHRRGSSVTRCRCGGHEGKCVCSWRSSDHKGFLLSSRPAALQ